MLSEKGVGCGRSVGSLDTSHTYIVQALEQSLEVIYRHFPSEDHSVSSVSSDSRYASTWISEFPAEAGRLIVRVRWRRCTMSRVASGAAV